ncbi:MAG TPA: fibronectin type III domain-containing protein [Candidatus Krumholzibacteria bacterium]|nr:fibronectin type III domain-containing protein [Candidatus Krumholzibacteria bacterium]
MAPDNPPFPPDGVFSVTGDNLVSLYWNPNQESDLAGYRVYRGNVDLSGPYYKIATVSKNQTWYDDTDVKNGETWFYAVTAYDTHGHESDLSAEDVFDTPRPEGFNLVLVDLGQDPSHAGYDFSSLSNASQSVAQSTTDIYFESQGGVNYVVCAKPEVDIQDYGLIDLIGVDWAPVDNGWAPSKRAEAIVGHSYIVRILNGQGDFNMAKFIVKNVTNTSLTLDWAYQAVSNNPELLVIGGTR